MLATLLDCLGARLSEEPPVCDGSSTPEGLEGEEHLDFPLKGFLKKIFFRDNNKKNFPSLGFGFCEGGNQQQNGNRGRKDCEEISEITLQSIYDLLSRKGYKTQKACD